MTTTIENTDRLALDALVSRAMCDTEVDPETLILAGLDYTTPQVEAITAAWFHHVGVPAGQVVRWTEDDEHGCTIVHVDLD